MSRVLVEYGGSTRALEARAGESLLELLRRSGFPVSAACGGNGTCGKCKVRLGDGREVLACRTPAEECRVIIEENGGGVICTESAASVCSVEAREGLGAAVDIGTTTVAVKLFDLRDGRELGVKSAWNAQTPYGADVITRCQTIMEHEDGLKRLSGLIREQVFGMAEELSRGEKIDEFFIAGNTVMEHIFMGLSPVSIAAAPFKPLSLFDGGEVFRERDAAVVCAPCVAGYVGGDITAGLLASGLFEKDECSLFLDVGTNGEMALGGRDGFLCCAVASGPAFEGAGISCGMASADGAISRVRWGQGGPDFQVIGGGEAKGICGSGLLDLLAMLLKLEIVDETGRLLPPDEAPAGFERWLSEDENGNGIFHLTDLVCLSAADVRQLQLAKAAVAAGIAVLTETAGISPEKVDRIYLAGGFGVHLDPYSAAAIGMLPDCLKDKTVSIGNSALAGAAQALLDGKKREQLLKIKEKCKYLELSGNQAFNRLYPEHMMFGEEDEAWN